MKNYHVSYCALASMLLLASCQEDFKDEVQPTISITAPAAGQKIWLDAPLTVDAADEQGVTKVAFYLNDELVGEDAEAPYELMLNTKQYEDGTYILRTVAYDGADNQTEVEQEVDIFNKLLTVEVEDNYLPSYEGEVYREWIVVSDSEGQILQTEELKNGLTFSFDRPTSFEDPQLSVTRISVNQYGDSYGALYATTYSDIEPDGWVMQGFSNDDYTEPTVLGTATGSFISPDYRYETAAPDGRFIRTDVIRYVDSVQVNFDLDLYQNPARLYVATFPYQAVPHYVSLESIQSEEHYELTSHDLIPMKVVKTINLPSANYAYMNVYGHYDTEGNSYYASESNLADSASSLPVYLPENVFNEYDYHLNTFFNDFSYHRSDYGAMPGNYDIPAFVPLTVTSTNRNNFIASVDYSHDYLSASWSDYDSDQAFEYVSWTVLGSGGDDIQFAAPSLPREITKEYASLNERVENLPYEGIRLRNRDDVSSYAEYTAKLYKRESIWDNKMFESLYIKNQDPENSRMAAKELPERVQREIKQQEKKHGRIK